jgi:hypothetical protein
MSVLTSNRAARPRYRDRQFAATVGVTAKELRQITAGHQRKSGFTPDTRIGLAPINDEARRMQDRTAAVAIRRLGVTVRLVPGLTKAEAKKYANEYNVLNAHLGLTARVADFRLVESET